MNNNFDHLKFILKRINTDIKKFQTNKLNLDKFFQIDNILQVGTIEFLSLNEKNSFSKTVKKYGAVTKDFDFMSAHFNSLNSNLFLYDKYIPKKIE